MGWPTSAFYRDLLEELISATEATPDLIDERVLRFQGDLHSKWLDCLGAIKKETGRRAGLLWFAQLLLLVGLISFAATVVSTLGD